MDVARTGNNLPDRLFSFTCLRVVYHTATSTTRVDVEATPLAATLEPAAELTDATVGALTAEIMAAWALFAAAALAAVAISTTAPERDNSEAAETALANSDAVLAAVANSPTASD
jgi:hypothetical protein